MNAPKSPVRPHAGWYAVSVGILLIGAAFAYDRISNASLERDVAVAHVKETGEIKIPATGPHTLYVMREASQRMNAEVAQAWDSAASATVVVRDNTTDTPLEVRDVYESIEFYNTRVAKLVEFDVDSPGGYIVQITPSLAALKPAVWPTQPLEEIESQIMGFVNDLIVGLAIAALATFAAAVIWLVVFLLRRKSKKQIPAVATSESST